MPITTTLKAIRAHSPCEEGWKILLKHLGKTKADDKSVAFSTIAESNGLDDAIWCLRSICPKHEKEVRLFAADCAERVLYIYESKYPSDDRPRKAIEAAWRFALGEIDEAAWAAAGAAAGAAARSAAWGDARSAAWAAAGAAAWGDAGDAECKIQLELLIKYFG